MNQKQKEKQKRKQFHILLAVCMALLVIALDLCFLLIPDKASSEMENRNLQQFPAMNWNTVTSGRFETLFDQYVADQFPGRNGWIGVHSAIARMAGNTMSHDIFLGKNGYLIQRFEGPTEEAYGRILEDFSEVTRIAENAEEMRSEIAEAAAQDEAETDIRVYALIAPTAVSVLKDLLPANAFPEVSGDEDAFLDRLYADLESLGIQGIDVREDLTALNQSGTQVYYRTDHHWTTDAAFEAWKAFARAAQIPADDVEYDRLAVTDQFQGTLSASSGFRADQKEAIYVYIPRETVPDTGLAAEPAETAAQEDPHAQEEANENAEGSADSGELRYVMINRDTGEKRASLYDTSFLDTRDKYALFMGGNHGEVKIQTSADSERNILVLKDSYANCFIPFLVPEFRNILVIDPRYYLGSMEQLVRDEQITDILFLYNAETVG